MQIWQNWIQIRLTWPIGIIKKIKIIYRSWTGDEPVGKMGQPLPDWLKCWVDLGQRVRLNLILFFLKKETLSFSFSFFFLFFFFLFFGWRKYAKLDDFLWWKENYNQFSKILVNDKWYLEHSYNYGCFWINF